MVKRVAQLFRPYRGQVGLVFLSILVTGALGVAPAFITKAIINRALIPHDLHLLWRLVLLMIAIPLVSGAIGVGQTYLTTVVGQRVMQDLRNRLYEHLQAMSLRFFTGARTGDLQSRLQNDVGGVQGVVTNTVSSVLSNVVTVLSTIVAMVLLSWQLTLLSLAVVPVFVYLTWRVGRARRALSKETQESLAELSTMTEETLSVSGILLAKVFDRRRDAIERYREENRRLARLQVRQQLVGPSGAGKTTISYLIPRLYDVARGRVELDGHDVRTLTQETLAAAVGMVTQETYLFHSTVRDNLLYAKPDASDEELEAAARAAQIHERILELSDGYDTLVGERGYRMSGGEKQRLAIARVILKDPRVLILDEATSALDTTSERLVQAALEPLTRDRTTIAIAHRLSTIIAADVIFVLDRGRLVQQGTHAELLAAGGPSPPPLPPHVSGGPVGGRGGGGGVLAGGEVVTLAT